MRDFTMAPTAVVQYRSVSFLLVRFLMASSLYLISCSLAVPSCPRVHLYNCAKFIRIRRKTDTCKFTFAVPAMVDGTCPEEGELSLAYVQVAKLMQKYEDLEGKVSELSGKEELLEDTAPRVTVRMRDDGEGLTETSPKTSGESDESFTVTITAHLTTDRDAGTAGNNNEKKNRKARSVFQHDDMTFALDSVHISGKYNYSHSEHRLTVSKTSDDVDPASENSSTVCDKYTVEVDELRSENKSLKSRLSKLEDRLERLESNFQEIFGT